MISLPLYLIIPTFIVAIIHVLAQNKWWEIGDNILVKAKIAMLGRKEDKFSWYVF